MKKRILSMLMAVLMTLSLVGVTAFATDDRENEPIYLENTEVSGRTIPSSVLDGHRIDRSTKADQVTESVAGVNAPTMCSGGLKVAALRSGENTPPVAELYAVILNPESVVNGNLTTSTQIAWLWEYGDEQFTYDPDGDEIISRSLNGISSSDILGYLSGDIGFVTQFQTPAQYIMTFQVQDENGAWSNVAQYTFAIEPTDGNTRPTCSIGISSSNIFVNQNMMISWASSSDPDTGDSIDGFAGVAILNGVSTNLSNYLVQLGDDYCVLAFPNYGTYQIRVHVCDTHGAWSNWFTFNLTVQGVSLTNVVVSGTTQPGASYSYWIYQSDAYDLNVQTTNEAAQYLLDHYGTHTLATGLYAKHIMDVNFSVSGRFVNESGSPIANKAVNISVPVVIPASSTLNFPEVSFALNKTVYTDSNGYFSYSPTSQQYWVDMGLYNSVNEVDLLESGVWYNVPYAYISQASPNGSPSNSAGTSFFVPTAVTVSTSGATSYSENVSCEVGFSQKPIIGALRYYDGQWHIWQ